MLVLLLALVLTGCTDADGDPLPIPGVDRDEDGYVSEDDCDDNDAAIRPDAEEQCDGVDNNCDGAVDEDGDLAGAWYADADGDSFGDLAAGVIACDAPAGTVADSTDCDDTEAARFPGNPVVCDSLDNDCDDRVDVGASAQIRQALIDLSDRGVAVLVVSEELDELFEICDRLAVIAQGRLSHAKPVAATTPPTKASRSRIEGRAIRRRAVKNMARPQAVAATKAGASGGGTSTKRQGQCEGEGSPCTGSSGTTSESQGQGHSTGTERSALCAKQSQGKGNHEQASQGHPDHVLRRP